MIGLLPYCMLFFTATGVLLVIIAIMRDISILAAKEQETRVMKRVAEWKAQRKQYAAGWDILNKAKIGDTVVGRHIQFPGRNHLPEAKEWVKIPTKFEIVKKPLPSEGGNWALVFDIKKNKVIYIYPENVWVEQNG